MHTITRKAVAVALCAQMLLCAPRAAALGQDADADVMGRLDYRFSIALKRLRVACERELFPDSVCEAVPTARATRSSDVDWATLFDLVADTPAGASRTTWFRQQLGQYLTHAQEWPPELSAVQALVKSACEAVPVESALLTRLQTARGIDDVLVGQVDLAGLDEASKGTLDCVEAIVDAEGDRVRRVEELLNELARLKELCGDCLETPDVVVRIDEIETELEKIRSPESRRLRFNLLKALASLFFFLQAAAASLFTGGEAMEIWLDAFYGSDSGGHETSYERLPASASEELDAGQAAELEGDTVPYDSGENQGIPVRFRKVGSGDELHLEMHVGSYATPWTFRDCATPGEDEGCVVTDTGHSLRELLEQPSFRLVGQVATGLEQLPDGALRWNHVTLRGEAGGMRFTILETGTRSRRFVLVVED